MRERYAFPTIRLRAEDIFQPLTLETLRMAKQVAGTKETALREMRQGTAAKMDAEALKRIAEARAIGAKAKKKAKAKGKR